MQTNERRRKATKLFRPPDISRESESKFQRVIFKICFASFLQGNLLLAVFDDSLHEYRCDKFYDRRF